MTTDLPHLRLYSDGSVLQLMDGILYYIGYFEVNETTGTSRFIRLYEDRGLVYGPRGWI